MIYDRRHTRDVAEFGGLAKVMPWYATIFVLVTMSSIGLPGTNGFVGEFLIITGTFSSELMRWSYRCIGMDCEIAAIGPAFSLLAVSGVVLGAVYMLDVTQKVFFGPQSNPKNRHLDDLNSREWTGLVPLVAMIFALGLFPQYFRDRIDPSVRSFLTVYNAKREALRDPSGNRTQPFLLGEEVMRLPEPVLPPAQAEPAHADNHAHRPAGVLLAQGD